MILAAALVAPAAAQTQIQKLLPGDPANWMNFGNAVALDGDVAVVGASTKSIGGLNYAGGVYVFRRQAGGAWLEEASLERPQPEIHDNFGTSVAVQGDLLVAGAPDFPYSSFTGIGAAYVYRRIGGVWQQEAELHGSTAHVDAGFGTAVALDGDRIMVRANLNSGGCVYVFERQGPAWVETAKFQAPAGGFQYDGFGAALALQGELVLVGASRLTVNGHFNAGKSFLYRHVAGVWSLEAELTAPVPDDDEYFGRAVALDGELAVVGLPPDHSACLFRHQAGAWPFEIRFKNQPQGGDFGAAVAVAGDLVLITAPGSDLFGAGAGAVHPFRYAGGSWQTDPPFAADDAAAGDGFGRSLALDGSRLLAGSWHDEPAYLGLGSAYLMDATPGLVLALNPTPPESGQDLDLEVRYGTPQAATWVAFSVRGAGATYVARLDVVLGLRNPSPLVGPAPTNAQGAASWTIAVPLAAAGRAAWFQAVQYRNASNLVAVTVL